MNMDKHPLTIISETAGQRARLEIVRMILNGEERPLTESRAAEVASIASDLFAFVESGREAQGLPDKLRRLADQLDSPRQRDQANA